MEPEFISVEPFSPWSFPAPYGLQFGINDSAVIAGTMTVAAGSDFETRAFVWTAVSQSNGATPPVQLFPAGVTNLSVASGESAMVSMATDINNRCEVVGKFGGSGPLQIINGRPCIWWPTGSGAVDLEDLAESFETPPDPESCEDGLAFDGIATAITNDDPPQVVGALRACFSTQLWPKLIGFHKQVEPDGDQFLLRELDPASQSPPESHFVEGLGQICPAGIFTDEGEIVVVGHEDSSNSCSPSFPGLPACPQAYETWVEDKGLPGGGYWQVDLIHPMPMEALHWRITANVDSFDPTLACSANEPEGLLHAELLDHLLVPLEGFELFDYGARARACEPGGAIVGLTWAPTGVEPLFTSCRIEMAVWDGVEGDIRSLHGAIDGISSDSDRSWGEGIARRADESTTAVGAMLDWIGYQPFGVIVDDALGTTPCGRRIDDIAVMCPFNYACPECTFSPACEDEQGPTCTHIMWALDVNVYGVAVAVGSYSEGVTTVFEVFIVTDRADLNGDGRIGGADVATVLGYWLAAECVGDVDGDGIVNGTDLAIILGTWTGNDFCEVAPACSDPCASESLVGETALAVALDLSGFADIEALAAWLIEAGPSADIDAICGGIAALTTVLEENLQGAGP